MSSASTVNDASLAAETARLLEFGKASVWAGGRGAAYLDSQGEPDFSLGIQTWITARMVHTFALAHLLGVAGADQVAAQALAGLTGVLHDSEYGGWYHGVDINGQPDLAAGKTAYDHAFVLLAAASAVMAGIPNLPGTPAAIELLADAAGVYLDKFWDAQTGRPVDTWSYDFKRLEPYRGLNATMHSVEALLAVADAVEMLSGSEGQGLIERPAVPEGGNSAGVSGIIATLGTAGEWRSRAASAAALAVELAPAHQNRLPEHFVAASDGQWITDLELNKDRPDDQFKPYGATPGHGLEWARLLLNLEVALASQEVASAPIDTTKLLPTAISLFDTAVADAWAVDGADGFAYTTNWAGDPVVTTRMHWVVCEAMAAAAALYTRTGDPRYRSLLDLWWDYAQRYLIDNVNGSWHHELDGANQPAATVWPGKPDIYHAVQATLIPRLPLAGSVPGAVLQQYRGAA